MLIIGAGGFAKELLQILHQLNQLEGLVFYDDVSNDPNDLLYEKFNILKNEDQVKDHFDQFDNSFIIGIGNPLQRYKMYKKFENLGGIISSCISQFARIGSYAVHIGSGTNILDNAIISNNVIIGKGCIIYYNTVLAHDCIINDFVEISPSANLLGRCQIGSFTQIGSNSTILPDIKIGENVIIGAGAVVTKDLPDNCIAIGVPAKIIKTFK